MRALAAWARQDLAEVLARSGDVHGARCLAQDAAAASADLGAAWVSARAEALLAGIPE